MAYHFSSKLWLHRWRECYCWFRAAFRQFFQSRKLLETYQNMSMSCLHVLILRQKCFFYGKRIFLTIIVITQVLLVLIFVHSLYIVILFFALIHIPWSTITPSLFTFPSGLKALGKYKHFWSNFCLGNYYGKHKHVSQHCPVCNSPLCNSLWYRKQIIATC